MKRTFIGLLTAMALFGAEARAQEFTEAPADIPRLVGPDVFIDAAKYQDKQIVITDGYIFAASSDLVMLKTGGVTFYVSTDDMDRESLRHFLKNCHSIGRNPGCTVHLLATPVKKILGNPGLAGAKISKIVK